MNDETIIALDGEVRAISAERGRPVPADPWADEPCGCRVFDGRCDTHAARMNEIHAAWTSGSSNTAMLAIWSCSDGYGEPGYVPEQGYDWSGIRDSSPAAVDAMWKAVHA